MKTAMIIALTMVIALTGCATKEAFRKIDDPITIGDKTYTALLVERTNPLGQNAVSLHLIETGTDTRYVDQSVVSRPYSYGTEVEPLTKTHLVNSNNQGGIGWANNALQQSVGDALMGASMMGAATLLRPSRTTLNGGGNSSSAAASATSGH